MLVWADKNSHALMTHFTLNIWMHIVDSRFVGRILPNPLRGVGNIFDVILLNQRKQMCFKRDDPPINFSIAIREHLHQTYPYK